MYCKNLKLKLNHKLECKLLKKEINIRVCNDCPFKALKQAHIQRKIKSRSITLARLEKSRTSLFTNDLEHCLLCGSKKEHIHEIFEGRNRQNSMKYKLCIPVCSSCHRKLHSDSNLALIYKQKGQALFNETYPDLDFTQIFKKNYL